MGAKNKMKRSIGICLMLAAVFATMSAVLISTGLMCQVSHHVSLELGHEPPPLLFHGGSSSSSSVLRNVIPSTPSIVSTDHDDDNSLIKPVDCTSFLEDVYNHRIDVNDTNDGRMFVRRTIVDPSFLISLHNKEADKVRFIVFDHGKYYEKALTQAFQDVLLQQQKATTAARVIDVGGNIGWFSLLSASMGFHVDAFEPNLINGVRLCESIYLNRWESSVSEKTLKKRSDHHKQSSSINLYTYGVGDVDNKTLQLSVADNGNPGMGTLVGSKRTSRRGGANSLSPTNARGERMVPIITLDRMAEEKGWFDSRPVIAILKVDVEGFEPQVFKGGQRLLKAHFVKNIFMEATNVGNNAETREMFSLIIEAGYKVYKTGRWSGPNNDYDGPTDKASIPDYLAQHCIPKIRAQCNLWFKLPDSK